MADPVAVISSCHVELIDHILKACPAPTTLVICYTREAFLQILQTDIHRTHPIILSELQEENDFAVLHPLLIPSIHLLATAKAVRLAFTPTLQHLRAYLATFYSTTRIKSDLSQYQSLNISSTTLMIIGLIALHRSTSEHSAQGLSRSISIAVEAASLANKKLVLAEVSVEDANDDVAIEHDTMNGRRRSPWEEQVPLLNGSIRFGNEENTWAGRKVTVGRVVEKWCRFGTLNEEADKS